MKKSLVAAMVALAVLIAVVPSATATTTWTARLGSYGVATIRVGSPDRLSINAKHFRARVAYPVSLRRGTCARLGTLVLSTRLTTSSTGTIVRSLYLTRTQTAAAKLPLSIRIGTKCAAFAAPAPAPTPVPTPQPSPSPSPSASPTPSPTPTPTPSDGSTLVMGNGFMLTLPAGWSYVPSTDPVTITYRGPSFQTISMFTLPTNLGLDGATTLIVAAIKAATGADPEQTESITMDAVPARLLTYHFTESGLSLYQLDAHTVNNGRLFDIEFMNVAGNEAADRAVFLGVLASFKFTGTP